MLRETLTFLLVGLTSKAGIVPAILSTPTALWLGRVSYSLYMTHGIVNKIVKILLPAERYVAAPLYARLLVLLAHAFLIFLAAAALYHIVEIPCRDFMRQISRWWSRRAVKLQPSPTAVTETSASS